MTKHVRVPDPVHAKATEIQEANDYQTIGEAIRAVFREAGHDV